MKYCNSTLSTKRFKTREVKVGAVGVGGDNPIRIQSMTTSSTQDIEGTISQIMKLADFGCEIARVTVQGKKEAAAVEKIKSGLIQKGYTIPVVADIHFYPPAAMMVADFADKVRINPGNFADRRATFKVLEYTDESYQEELYKIEEKFAPLVMKCKELKKAIRIGTNHGSLSDRIMNRFGDTPEGMVESALEFARICRQYDFHDIIFSMKASNPLVMIQAYRQLVAQMVMEGMNYPLHLGVTEAGSGNEGRIKSAIGIGSLLADGLGDTIRVSLTEDPWEEIAPCRDIIEKTTAYQNQSHFELDIESFNDAKILKKREKQTFDEDFINPDGTAFIEVTKDELSRESFYEELGFKLQLNNPMKTLQSPEGILVCEPVDDKSIRHKLQKLKNAQVKVIEFKDLHTIESALATSVQKPCLVIQETDLNHLDACVKLDPELLILDFSEDFIHFGRRFIKTIEEQNFKAPILLRAKERALGIELISQAMDVGVLLADGLGDGVVTSIQEPDLSKRRNLALDIMQACRMRSFKTEYIACPGCGRTLFNLQKVTKEIQEKTAHLPGLKIAVMGCIVNGPGEMADADFGYVGSRGNMIDLYIGRTCVEKNIDSSEATERLIKLIKQEGKWVEPENVKTPALV